MENSQIQGKLNMYNLRFTQFSFTNNLIKNKPIDVNFTFQVRYTEIDKKNKCVEIRMMLSDLEKNISLNIVEKADFELINAELLEDELKETLFKVNTIAIMFPYLRSQVALLTTQPGMNSIQIPIINAEDISNNCTVTD